MASPFAVFRRNQKIMLATVGIGAMIAFVFLQPLMDYVGRRQAPQNPVVVETRYGDFKESELEALQQARELVDLFLRRAAIETVEAQIAKGQFDARYRDSLVENLYRQSHAQLMSRSKPGPEGAAIETLILAKKAEELGMLVSDRAINDLLAELTLDSLSSDTVLGIVNNLQAGRRVSTARLFQALRSEMLAANLQRLFAASLGDVPPAQKFDYFQRLNRRAKAEIVPLAVVDFTRQVENPGDDVLRPFYEKYKNRLPDAASPEPGFKEPTRAAFQYFKADFTRFTDEMKPQVTEEEIRDYYENNKAQFIALDLPQEDQEPPDEEAPPGESKPHDEGAEEPAGKESAEDSSTPEGDSPAGKSTAPEGDLPNDEAQSDEPEPAPPKETQSADEPSAVEASDEVDTPQLEQSSGRARATLRLISTAAQSGEAPQEESAPDASDEGPAIDGADDVPDEKPADKASDKPQADSETPDVESAKPAESADDAAAPSEEAPQETRYEPLEKVQDQIRDSIAARKAGERIGEIFDKLQAEMRNYSDERDIYNARKDSEPGLKPPAPLPFAELAEKHRVAAKELPLVSAGEAADEDIGAVYRVVQDPRTQFGFRSESFAEFAFSESLPTYRPYVENDNDGNSYLFWKTEEVASFVPTFEAAHDKVLAAWKMIEARPLAHKRAEELAAQARAAGKPLKEVFDGDAGLTVIETDSFSWMTRGSVPANPMGGGSPRISQVEGVERIGRNFMETVFGLAAGQIGVAENHSKDTVYIVRLAEYEQSIDQLRDEFAKERPALYMAVAQPELRAMYLAWIEGLEKQADVHWLRRADVARRGGGEETSPL